QLEQQQQEQQQQVLPVASEKMCYSCHHGVVVESRLAIKEQHQHPTIYNQDNAKYNQDNANQEQTNKKAAKSLKKREDTIPKNFPLSQHQEFICTSCHTPHNSDENQEVLYQGHTNSWMRVSNHNGNLCERCHESKAVGARVDKQQGVNHPLGIKFLAANINKTKKYVQETHLQHGIPAELKKNGAVLDKQQQLICQTCHQIHAGKEQALLTLENTHNELCISCHKSKYAQGKEKSHQQGLHPVNIELEKVIKYKAKDISKVLCDSCHRVHKGEKGTALLSEVEHKLCISCHKDKFSDSPQQAHQQGVHPVNFKLEKPRKQNGKFIDEISCSSCHSMHQGLADTALFPQQEQFKKAKDKQQALCASCHQQQSAKDKPQARQKGIHPVNIKLDKAIKYQGKIINEVTCASCHKVHQGKLNTALLWDGTEKNIEKLCTICHQQYTAKGLDNSLKKGIHPINVKLENAVTINNKKVQTINCLSCHSVHHGEKQTAVLVQTDNNGELCKNCHKQQQKVLNSDHDLRLSARYKKNKHGLLPQQAGLCGSCHSMHKGAADKLKTAFLSAVKPVAASSLQTKRMDKVLLQRDLWCINCHQDNGLAKEKVVNRFSHPYKDLILRSDPKQMPLLKLTKAIDNTIDSNREVIDEFGIIACISCHNPHSWEPIGVKEKIKIDKNISIKNKEGNSNNSFLRQQDIKGRFCVSCHGLEARIEYKYYHEPK
ncbi:MAG: cytochrome c3 family protein, partial [Pseudomonadota bacterium]